MICRLGGHIRG